MQGDSDKLVVELLFEAVVFDGFYSWAKLAYYCRCSSVSKT